MILSTDKTKLMVFNGGRKKRKGKLKQDKVNIEEVVSFKYLGFTFNRNGNYKEHIKELSRKRMLAARKV